ncbi:hypothetical protein RFI_39693, partial [Reticulomyxa filosa]
PFGHSGKHHTEHGNMLHSTFIVENNNSVEFKAQTKKKVKDSTTAIEKEVIEDTVRVYTTGDTAEAEICDFFCEKMGRGHFHLIKCNHPGESCDIVHTTQNNESFYLRRHANPEECGGRIDLDKVTHEYYWEKCLKFEDPCQPLLQKQFERCSHYCPHPDHEKTKDECDEVKKSYCAERLWHDPVTEQKSNATNTTVMDGHKFFFLAYFLHKKTYFCSQISIKGFLPLMSAEVWPLLMLEPKEKKQRITSLFLMHVVLTTDWVRRMMPVEYLKQNNFLLKLCGKKMYKYIIPKIVYSFIQQRWQTGHRDTGTFIFYESTAKIIKENIAFNQDLVSTILYPAHVPWGGTSFVNAIRCVYDVVKRNASKHIVLIFLTDGEDGDNGASELLAEIKAFCSNGFHFFPCILSTWKSSTLDKMASSVDATVKENLDANSLETHFVGIAKRLTNISFTQD